MSGTTPASKDTGGVVNPCIRAYKAGALGVGPTCRGKFDGPLPGILGLPVVRVRKLTDRQLRKWIRAGRHASAASLELSRSLDIGTAAFEATIAPTVGDLLTHSQKDYTHPSTFLSSHTIPSCLLTDMLLLVLALWYPRNIQSWQTEGCTAGYRETSPTMWFDSSMRIFLAYVCLRMAPFATRRSDS